MADEANILRSEAASAGEFTRLLTDQETYQAMASATCPYGDGRAAERIVDVLVSRYAAGGRARRETA